MPFSARDAFKYGFLMRCAEEGLEGDALETRIKLAGFAGDAVKKFLGTGLGAVKTIGGVVLPVTALAGGFGAGMLGAKMTEQEVDPEEAKVRELVAAYRQQSDRIRRSSEQRRREEGVAAPRSARLY